MAIAPFEMSSDQALASMLMQRRNQSERVIYYRKPGERFASGTPNREPHWIVWGDSQEHKMITLVARGFQPLPQFGRLQAKAGDESLDGPFDLYGIWGPILSHPEGPSMFPVDQLMVYRWYDPAHCPVPNVKFPQLSAAVKDGLTITEYSCPECTDRIFLEPLRLARHMRLSHEYTTEDIVGLGKAMGVDFDREFARKGVRKVLYGMDDAPPAPIVTAEPPLFTTVTPTLSGEVAGMAQILTCAACGWQTRPDHKSPASALRMHQRNCKA